jgi:hypothetical protein
MVRAQLTRTATLLLSGTNSLSELIDRAEFSRAMLATSIDLLHEAAQALNLVMNGAGRILALHHEGVFGGPLPASIHGARRIAGHLSGILPRASYLQISQCWCWLRATILANFIVGAHADVITSAEMLILADESAQSQRWSDRMAIARLSSMLARRRLADADGFAADVHLVLLKLVTYWHPDPDGDHGVWRVDPSVDLSWAEENLHAATDLMDMDQAPAGMRRIHKALELQALELLIVARNHQ